MKNAEQVTFGGSGFNRAAHLRRDAGECARLLRRSDAAILALWRGRPLMLGDPPDRVAWLPAGHPVFEQAADDPVFLGLQGDGQPRFARDIPGWEPENRPDAPGALADAGEQRHPAIPEAGFGGLRAAMARLSAQDAELSATARALIGWHESHRFCARCGAPDEMAQAGWQRNCPSCGAQHFPRINPVVIMLILHGNGVLIGRSPGWPEGLYSLPAGFVEPGETLEAAVRREVEEETGVAVGPVSYLASQPWPFPASLMVGCLGRAESRDMNIDPVEIEDALWVSREEMALVFAGRHGFLRPPRAGSIARFLLEKWLADQLGPHR